MNPLQFINSFRMFMSNPQQFLSGLNLPQEVMGDPKAAVQYLMNNGAMSQQQFNQLSQVAKSLQNNPQFMSMFNK